MSSFTIDYDIMLANTTNGTSTFSGSAPVEISTTIKDKIMKGFYVGISSLGIFGNIIVLIVLFSLAKMRKKLTSLFIINQSIVDALTALFLLLTTVLPPDGRVYKSLADDFYCRFWVTRFPLWLCIHCSTYNLVALTIERYVSVVHPVVHKLAFNRVKAMLMVATTWLLSVTHNLSGSMPYVYIAGGLCKMGIYNSKSVKLANGIVGFCLIYLIPITILIYCYGRMAYALTTKNTSTATNATSCSTGVQQSANKSKPHSNMKARAGKNVIKTLMIVSTLFILCNSWNQWFFFFIKLGVFDYRAFSTSFYQFSVVAMFANCCVNPFVYAAQYEEFQNGLRKIFCRWRNASVEPSVTLSPSAAITTN
ncbi:hypothetical protein LSH36_12g08047 [Paralvinella palmiformis]|uniref:G-protein coupled receptors family 1 profile domain-containing protein n=1 Tax=Paralvinella palmiformis TaxID=53620 RepID=A0AAD9KDA1_9ANNE|nr:hypothetical protein LSH36_12g08047 [Paralvinella palmiformis]